MQRLAFELELPDDAVDARLAAEVVRSAKERVVLRLYIADRLRAAESAKVLGLSRLAFLDLLATSGVGLTGDMDELDVAAIRQWRRERQQPSS